MHRYSREVDRVLRGLGTSFKRVHAQFVGGAFFVAVCEIFLGGGVVCIGVCRALDPAVGLVIKDVLLAELLDVEPPREHVARQDIRQWYALQVCCWFMKLGQELVDDVRGAVFGMIQPINRRIVLSPKDD